jgi:hypothetical protein
MLEVIRVSGAMSSKDLLSTESGQWLCKLFVHLVFQKQFRIQAEIPSKIATDSKASADRFS